MGLKPRNLDVGSIIRIHDNIMHKTIANNKFLDELKTLKEKGIPLIERVDKAPINWVRIDNPALTKVLFIPGKPVKGERVSDELRVLLNDMGLAVGRRLSPTVFGKPSKKAGQFRPGEPPEINLQKFFTSTTLTHEIGHFIDVKLNLGKPFVENFKNEIFAINRERIERLSKMKGQIAGKTFKEYAESDEEQIAEFFAMLFTDPQKASELAPNATSFMLSKLGQDGVMSKLVDFNFEKRGKELVKETANLLVRLPVAVHPDLVKPLKVVFDQRVNTPIVRAYEAINGVLKKMQLSFSLFHHFALGETSIATMGVAQTADVAFNYPKIYKALAKGEFEVYKDLEVTKKWIERGMQIGATADIPVKKIQDGLDRLAAKTKNVPVGGKVAQLLAQGNELWDKALWNYYHDTLKLYAAEHLATTIDPTIDIVKQEEEIALLINDTFGGQNWATLMVSPKTVQKASWFLLSPDWTLSTIRQGLALTGAGGIHKELSQATRGRLGRRFWFKAFLYFGIGINLLNLTFRKWDRKNNPEKYTVKDETLGINNLMAGNSLGHKTHLFVGRFEDGTERYIRWGKQFREVPELFVDDLGVSPFTASIKKIGGKAAPLLQQASLVFTGHSLSGFEVREISQAEGWERAFATARELLFAGIPFAFRDIVEEGQSFALTDIAFPDSKGMTRAKAIRWFKISYERQDERLFTEVFANATANELPVLTLMDAAATSLKAERTRDITNNIDTVEEVDALLDKTADEKERRSLLRFKQRLLKERAEFNAVVNNIKLFNASIKKIQFEFDIE